MQYFIIVSVIIGFLSQYAKNEDQFLNSHGNLNVNNSILLNKSNSENESLLYVKDVTNDMINAHNPIAKTLNTQYFRYDHNLQKKAHIWCEIQVKTGCDLVYPINLAFNAAKVASLIDIKDIVQYWYNEISKYDDTATIKNNIKKSQISKYEIVHFLNIVSNTEENTIGCCRGKCNNNVFVYGCAYNTRGGISWITKCMVYLNNNFIDFAVDNDKKNVVYDLNMNQSLKNNKKLTIPTEAKHLIRRINNDEFIDVGCSGNVAGNGPLVVSTEWAYPCFNIQPLRIDNQVMNDYEKTYAHEDIDKDILFSSTYVYFLNSCQNDIKIDFPAVIHCSPCHFNKNESVNNNFIKFPLINLKSEHIASNIEKNGYKGICGMAEAGKYLTTFGLGYIYNNNNGKYEYLRDGPFNSFDCTYLKLSLLHSNLLQDDILYQRNKVWVYMNLSNSQLHDLATNIFLLSNSFCSNYNLTFKLIMPENSPDRVTIFTSFINLANFVSLTFYPRKKNILVQKYLNKQCTIDQTIITNDFRGAQLTISIKQSNDTVEVYFDGEKITDISNNHNVSNFGFFGVAIDNFDSLNLFTQIIFVPRFLSQNENRNLSSFLPKWNILVN